LYTLEEGKISVPITLAYHASGFRPDVHPGWVGMGWTLSAGGMVTRIVHDRIDEYALPNDPTNPLNLGFYFQHGQLSASNWEQASFIENTLINGKYSSLPEYNYFRDTEPDEFNFSFLNFSGSFYMNHDGTWKAKCDKSIKVELLTTPNVFTPCPFTARNVDYPYLKSYTGFILTGDDGTRYQFGGTTESIEYSTDFFGQGNGQSPMTANAWQLTKITDSDGRVVNFTYRRETGDGRFVNQMYYSIYQDLGTSVAQGGSNTADFFFLTKSNCNGSSSFGWSNYVEAYQSGQLISPVYLTSISSANSTISFNSSQSRELRYRNELAYADKYDKFLRNRYQDLFLPMLDEPFSATMIYPQSLKKLQWKKLDDISINCQGQFIKKFQFGYSDAPGNEANADQQRLTLKSLREIGYTPQSGLQQKPAYLFEYNPQSLPNYNTGYLANSSDHWGFFNGVYAAINGPDYINTYAQAREATSNLTFATLGMLTRITYPTGGSTEFEYETPRYGKCLYEDRSLAPEVFSSPRVAGGVRIKKIKSYLALGSTPALEKEYFYVTGFRNGLDPATLPSSGVLSGKSRYYFGDYRSLIRGYQTSSNPAVYSKNIFCSQPVIPASSNRGTHVGYSEVVERRSDMGYTKYTYSNFDTGASYRDEVVSASSSLMPQRTIYQPYASAEETRGQLLKEEAFNANNVRVKVREIEYVAFNKANEYVRSVNAQAILACSGSDTDAIEEGTAYRIYTYSFLPIQETETLYDLAGNHPVTTVKTTQYHPAGYRLVASTSVTDSKNQTVTTSYRYPVDITFPGTPPVQPLTDPVAAAISTMATQNMINSPIEIVTSRSGRVVGATVQTYRIMGVNNSRILPYQLFSLESSQPLSAYTATAFGPSTGSPLVIAGGNAQMQLKATHTQYDSNGNLLSAVKGNAQLVASNRGRPTSYLWDYNNTLPVATVENAGPSEIFSSSFEKDRTSFNVPVSPGTWDSYQLRVESYPTDNSSSREVARTGRMAGGLYTTSPQEQAHAFGATLTIAPRTKRFVFSGWVYSNGPQASIWLFMNRPAAKRADGTIDYYHGLNNNLSPAYVNTNVTGRWVYLEKEVEVPADVTMLGLRLTNYYNGASLGPGGVWFDDVRIYPADAQMTTYTHAPGVGITSISDANNKPTTYEYDAHSRLLVVRDQDGNILKQYEYNYRAQ
jgi:YD repeat-containing protein